MKSHLLLASPVASALLSSHLLADPLNIGPGQTLKLGDPDQPMSFGYDSLTIDTGGTLDMQGDVTVTVPGDIVISGTISVTPQDKAPDGDPGMNGLDGPDNQPTGQNVGLHGQFAGTAPSWVPDGTPQFRPAPRLTLECEGTVLINGTIRLEPAYDGGDGGQGGKGGNGGSGISPQPGKMDGAYGGGAGNGGDGGNGGHGLSAGAALRIVAQRIDLAPTGKLLLDNLSSGGKGGRGGDGGEGGRGGDGIKSGHGGHGGRGGTAGNGGTGGLGGTGGRVDLVADVINLLGEISLKGGDGGDGGPAGDPGRGGDGGGAGPAATDTPAKEGGDGGNAGNYLEFGGRGGMGGPGGNGGSIYLWARQSLNNSATMTLAGGKGGQGGPGVPASRAQGGMGGSPDGEAGTDSVLLPDGDQGEDGLEGRVYVRVGWASQFFWWIAQGSPSCVGPLVVTDGGKVRTGGQLCGGTCLASFVRTGGEAPYELRFDHRWLSTSGTLTISLAGVLIHSVSAPSSLADGFQTERVLITDPNLFGPYSQRMEICLEGDESSAVQISEFRFAASTAPVLATSLVPSGDALEIEWTSGTDATYQLQTRSSLVTGSWNDVGGPLMGTGGRLTSRIDIAHGESEAFFRVVVSSSQ